MPVLRALVFVLFLPGTIVLSKLGISVEEDSGILRSFINAIVWGIIALLISLKLIG